MVSTYIYHHGNHHTGDKKGHKADFYKKEGPTWPIILFASDKRENRKVQNSGFGFVWEFWVMRELLDKLKLREFCWASWSPFYLKINIQNLSSWRRSRKPNQSPIFNPCSSWISQILHMHSFHFFLFVRTWYGCSPLKLGT